MCRPCMLYISVFVAVSRLCWAHAEDNSSKVLLISIDGFRWDFRDKTYTPNLDGIVQVDGVSAEYVKNVFPTSTLPNHQSIVTGMYPENHGMLDNSFMDPLTGRLFHGLMKNYDLEWWNQSTPIWTADELEGHKSGVLFWPGYRVKYKGKLPSFLPPDNYTAPYEPGKSMKMKERVDLAVSWLKNDDVNLVVLYTEEPDETAHNFAPDSNKTENKKKVVSAIKSVDDLVKYLKDELWKNLLVSKVNVIMLGDHGHVNTTHLNNIHLDDYIDTKKETRFIGAFTDVFIYPKYNRTKFVYETLKNATSNNSHYQVYLKNDIPDDFRIKKNNNTADILLLPDPGWTVTADINEVPYLKGEWERGDHGYSNKERLMNPAFFAFGPEFRKAYRKKCVHTVDIYALIAHILKLKEPVKTDGKFERIKSVLLEYAWQFVINETSTSKITSDDISESAACQ